MFIPETVQLPLTLQPGESVIVPGPMPPDIKEVRHFIVHDALGKQWKASTDVVMKQLAARTKRTAV